MLFHLSIYLFRCYYYRSCGICCLRYHFRIQANGHRPGKCSAVRSGFIDCCGETRGELFSTGERRALMTTMLSLNIEKSYQKLNFFSMTKLQHAKIKVLLKWTPRISTAYEDRRLSVAASHTHHRMTLWCVWGIYNLRSWSFEWQARRFRVSLNNSNIHFECHFSFKEHSLREQPSDWRCVMQALVENKSTQRVPGD